MVAKRPMAFLLALAVLGFAVTGTAAADGGSAPTDDYGTTLGDDCNGFVDTNCVDQDTGDQCTVWAIECIVG